MLIDTYATTNKYASEIIKKYNNVNQRDVFQLDQFETDVYDWS